MTTRGEVLVVGSIGLDTIITPAGQVSDAMGGSAIYFACAASLFSGVNLVGVAGTDYPEKYKDMIRARGVDLSGLEIADGRTFRWTGRYHEDMDTRETIETQLNVFEHFQPKIPQGYVDDRYIFLANGAPETQASVLDQVASPKFIMLDTMNLWIEIARPALVDLLGKVDALVINDEEALMLTGSTSLIRAAEEILEMGPRTLIVKKGSNGAMLLQKGLYFALPAFPLQTVVDPTGAGDCFAGALMGHLACTDDVSHENLRRAIAYGTATASFTCEGFGVDGICAATREDVEERYHRLAEMTKFA